MLSQLKNPHTSTTDLALLSTFLNASTAPKIQPRNLSELSDIVKKRINESGQPSQSKNYCREWLKEKGMDLKPLLDHLTLKKRKQVDTSDNEWIPDQPLGKSVIQPILQNHEKYIEKAIEYADTNLRQFVATKKQIRKKHFKKIMLNLGCEIIGGPQTKQAQTSPSYSTRDKLKTDRYIKVVERLLEWQLEVSRKEGRLVENDRVIRLFYEGVRHKLWSIMFKQVQGVDFGRGRLEVMTSLLLNSLKIVEEEFSQEVPLNKHALTYYLQQKYLNKLESSQYIFHPQQGCIWGKVFLYFRSGRLREAIQIIEKIRDTSMIRDIETSTQSIKQRNPEKVRVDHFQKRNCNDVFRNQILYALGGIRMYSSEVLTNPATLECIWVLLRNTGIYYQTDSQEFEEIREQIADYYINNKMEQLFVYFGAYILHYDAVAQLTQNQVMDKDDLMHLLIILYRYPSLVKDQGRLTQRLAEYALSYAIELENEGREEYLYYLMMIPTERIVEDASTMIAESNLYSKIKWGTLKKYMPSNLFKQLIIATSQKYIFTSENYLEAAINVVQLISDRSGGLELLTQMLVEHILQKKIHKGEDVSKALRFYLSWSQQPQVDRIYPQLCSLFKTSIQLNKALIDRDSRTVESIVIKRVLIFGDNLNFQNAQMLQKLKEKKGVQVFFIFLTSLVRGAHLILSHEQDREQLRNYQAEIYKTAKTVAADPRFQRECQENTMHDLMMELSSALVGESFESYRNFK